MKKKILIVEDTLDVLNNLRDLLTMEEYEVILAVNGEDALYKFYLYTPDLILTDLRMPKMDGFQLIENIKKNESLQHIPILVFSANATSENELRTLQLGADRFLKKPCSTDTLLDAIKSLIEQHRS